MDASVGSLIVAAIALLLSVLNTTKKDTKDTIHQMTKLITKLDTISEDIRDIKRDMTDMRVSIQDNHDRILKLEMSLSTAWKRIDEIKGGGTNGK